MIGAGALCYNLTVWGEMRLKRPGWPGPMTHSGVAPTAKSNSDADRWCDEAQAPMATRHGGSFGTRMTWGRCGSLCLHRDGLAPSPFHRSPGAPVHSITSGLMQCSAMQCNAMQCSKIPPAPLCGRDRRPPLPSERRQSFGQPNREGRDQAHILIHACYEAHIFRVESEYAIRLI
jgi:hypothetical protein